MTNESKQVATQTTWFDFSEDTPIEETILPGESYVSSDKALATMTVGQPYLIIGGWQDLDSEVAIEAKKIWVIGCS